jgi:hypothetical protein
MASRGEKLPQSFVNIPRVQKASAIVQIYAGFIREFIIKRKEEGKVVEVPDVSKFLKEEHSLNVTRSALRLAMKRMGLKWGPKKKLMVHFHTHVFFFPYLLIPHHQKISVIIFLTSILKLAPYYPCIFLLEK